MRSVAVAREALSTSPPPLARLTPGAVGAARMKPLAELLRHLSRPGITS